MPRPEQSTRDVYTYMIYTHEHAFVAIHHNMGAYMYVYMYMYRHMHMYMLYASLYVKKTHQIDYKKICVNQMNAYNYMMI